MKTATVTHGRDGAHPFEVPVEKIVVPDLWHVAMRFEEGMVRDTILDAWHLAQDLLYHARNLHDEETKREINARREAELDAEMVEYCDECGSLSEGYHEEDCSQFPAGEDS